MNTGRAVAALRKAAGTRVWTITHVGAHYRVEIFHGGNAGNNEHWTITTWKSTIGEAAAMALADMRRRTKAEYAQQLRARARMDDAHRAQARHLEEVREANQ